MAYYKFSTEKADYVFEGINHLWGRHNHDLFQGIDALVVENVTKRDYQRLEVSGNVVFIYPSQRGGRKLECYLQEKRIPVFCLDVAKNEDNTASFYFTDNPIETERDRLYLFFRSMSSGLISDEFRAKMLRISQQEQKPRDAGRSVIAATKLEHYLAHNLQQRIKRKPFIGIVYGLAHVDIVDYLLDEKLREETLDFHRQRNYPGLLKENLSQIIEGTFFLPTNSWTFKAKEVPQLRKIFCGK